MGELWRSKKMELVQLYIQKDAAHDTIDELGERGLIQFHDLNPDVNPFQRHFVNEVKRFDEMERRLRFFTEQVRREEAQLALGETLLSVTGVSVPASDLDEHGRPVFDITDLEAQLERYENEIRNNNQNLEVLLRGFVEALEMKHVLTKDTSFFTDGSFGEASAAAASSSSSSSDSDAIDHPLLGRSSSSSSSKGETGLQFLSGVILKSRLSSFERVIWRTLHGNLLQKSEDIEDEIEDPATGEMLEKAVFIVFFHGGQSELKVRRICDAFGARICECPDSLKERQQMLAQVEERLEDMARVIDGSKAQRRESLAAVSAKLSEWKNFVVREKAIYHVLNMCQNDIGRKCIVAEGWVPEERSDDVLTALDVAGRRSGQSVPSILQKVKTTEEPPTYYPITPFTSCFYNIVDSYGTARYEEVSPVPFSIITFPFLFAIMFGDAGHAILMLLASIAMIVMYPKLQGKRLNEIFDMLLGGRYMILLMSIFSIYTGLLYNEIFCIPYPLFQRTYHQPRANETAPVEECEYGKECVKDRNTYPFGIDPVWREADNELFIYNSLKMKVSIVFGVIQMLAGTFLSLFNHIHYKNYLDIVFGFIPQVLFMVCTFGYMTFLIFYKWLAGVDSDAPYIINIVIDMFLQFNGLEEGFDNKGKRKNDDFLYSGQNKVQVVLAVIAVISAIAMLIPKPIVKLVLYKRRRAVIASGAVSRLSVNDNDAAYVEVLNGDEDVDAEEEAAAENEEEFKFGDEFIQNAIHAIEYILGCISNTASYLRLWALSLAHSQLSIVFYEQIFVLGLSSGNFFLAFVCFAVWGGATIAILLMMEALSAFLHALRLHWVEFMNKFYLGDGYPFIPFSFTTAYAEAEAAEDPNK